MLLDAKIPSKVANLEHIYDGLRFAAIAEVPVEMSQTPEHFREFPTKTARLIWRPMAPGEAWGDNWISAWFRGRITIPPEYTGRNIFLRAETGAPETLLLVDGRQYGVFDANHPVRLLAQNAVAGRSYQIHLEAYAGHSHPGTQPFEGIGLLNDPAVTVERNGRTFKRLELAVERADVSAFVFELRALHQLASGLDEHSLRRGKILAGLQKLFTLVYAKPAEVSEAVWRAALAQARAVMRPLLDRQNGPTMPMFGIIGHSHIDTAWLWPVQETIRKCARTFSSVLSLMDQYPDFRFTQSASYHSALVRQHYPDLFRRMQQRVKEERWEINGAMWVEPDCNIPGGESLIRQCLIGQQSTREMFGVTSDTLWQPDVFGYSGALPQILRGAGVKYFCTTKLAWNDTNRFPYDTFVWRGIDGTPILSHFNVIHCWPDPQTLLKEWNWVQHKDVQDRRLLAFGYGDGGGGPQCEMIEMARITQNLEGCPRVGYTTVSEFMANLERDSAAELPVYAGELYLELHRGTLTSIAKIKRGNRKCELALRDAEFACALATLRAGAPYPTAELREAWKILLLNQFHDILPGSSIMEVNDRAIADLDKCERDALAFRDSALNRLSSAGDRSAVLLFNSLNWDRRGEMEIAGLPAGMMPAGAAATQFIENVAGDSLVAVAGLSVPSLGYCSFPLVKSSREGSAASPFRVTAEGVKTPFAVVRFDDAGRIDSFFDKAARRELVRNGGWFNQLLMGEDVPAAWDNWDIDRDQRLKLRPQDRLVSRQVIADGPLQLRIRLEYQLGQGSKLVQHIVFHAATSRVDFDTLVDWREGYQFLKVGFALDVLAEQARHEIQFGHVSRNTHDNTTLDRAQFDVCAHKWTDISEGSFGVAFLNDCKYACTVKDGEYRLSLIKSGRHPDPRGDQGTHRFVYAMLPHAGGFNVENVVRPAYEFNLPPAVHLTSIATESFSLASVDAANIVIESIKWAEEGKAFVLRLYEAGKTGTHANVRFHIPIMYVRRTNLLEVQPEELAIENRGCELYLRPFEIVTLCCGI